MQRAKILTAAAVFGASGMIAGLALAASPDPLPGPPAAVDPAAPSMPEDLGVGERLLLVVGGVYGTREEAIRANAEMSFGDVQGYYVAPVAQFEGLRTSYPAGDWALVSAFRTREGAQEFAELARVHGVPATITGRVTSLGGSFAGLGQEAAPDGSGPLSRRVPASLPTREDVPAPSPGGSR